MPGYAAQPSPVVPGTVVSDPWDTELESVIAELQALQEARAQMASAPEPVRYEMPADDVPPMMRNALAGGGGGQVGPAADNALAFDPDPRANPYMSLRPMPSRTMARAMDPMMPVQRVERTDPLALEQQSADDWQRMADVSGYTMARSGVGNIGEGISERDPLRVAGGAAQVGLAALPYGGPFAKRAATWAFSSPWAPARVGGTALVAGPGAEGKLSADVSSGLQYMFGTPAEAQTRLPRKQRQEIEAERQRAENAARIERESREAEVRLEKERQESSARLSVETEASRIRAKADAERQAEKDRVEAENSRRREVANMPTRERFADFMPYVVPATMALATAAGVATKGLATRTFNRELGQLEERWQNALARGDRAKSAAAKQRALDEAEGLGVQFNALKTKGPGGSLAAPLVGGTVGEIGIFLPEEIDLARAIAGSELQEKTLRPFRDDPYLFPQRFGAGLLMGAAPAKAGSVLTERAFRASPVGYTAETEAFKNALGPRVSPRPQGQQQLPATQSQGPAATVPPANATSTTTTAGTAIQGQRVLMRQKDSLGRIYHTDPNSKYPGRRVAAPRSEP